MAHEMIVAQDLSALTTLNENQQEMLENILSRFTGASAGAIGMDVGDSEDQPLRVPVLKIRQRMTTDPGCPDTAKDGDLYTTAGDLLPRPVRFLPVAIWTSHVMFEAGGGKSVVCYSPDARLGSEYGECSKCPNEPWKNNTQTDCDRTLNAIIMTEGLGLYHVRFSSTSYPAGKNLVRFVRAMPNMWSRFFKLETSSRKNQKGEFQVFEVKAVQDIPSPDIQKVGEYVCVNLHNARTEMLAGYRSRILGGMDAPAAAGAGGVKTVTIQADDAEPDFTTM